MTVKELIKALQKLPPDAKVYYADGEYNGSATEVRELIYTKLGSLAAWPNTVTIV